MRFLKEYPLFTAFIAICLILFGVGCFLVLRASAGADESIVRLERTQSQLRSALALNPAPVERNLRASEANLDELRSALQRQIAYTEGTRPDLISTTPPASPSDMLFQLQAYRDQLTQDARRLFPVDQDAKPEADRQRGVSIPENFAWGFSRYIDSGTPPSAGNIGKVYQQQQILSFILRKLLNTRPISIRSVQREPVAEAAGAGRGRTEQRRDLTSDEFRVGAESARVAGAVDTLPFRIVFTGYTQNLRSFLVQLQEFELPLVVRSVEVRPLAQQDRTGRQERRGQRQPEDIFEIEQIEIDREPVVIENISEFTVVVEFIDVKVSI